MEGRRERKGEREGGREEEEDSVGRDGEGERVNERELEEESKGATRGSAPVTEDAWALTISCVHPPHFVAQT